MYYTLNAAIAEVTSICEDREIRIKALKKILEQTELALINSATQSGVVQYQINSGQSVINVKQGSYTELLETYRKLRATLNEIYGIELGTNLMAMRDAQSNFRYMEGL